MAEASLRSSTSVLPLLDRLSAASRERRESARREFPYRLLLTPIDKSGSPQSDAPVEVIGRDLSPRGVGFEHSAPLPFRRVRLRAADPDLARIGLGELEIDVVLRWCRFVGPGRYESGGQIDRSAARSA